MNEGGDKHTPGAKADIAQREHQIVALKLRGITAPEIARVIHISVRAVHAAFNRALRRQTEAALDMWHRMELGKLDMEEANVWRAMDANKADWKAQMAGTAQLRGIHIRRAKLLGLDTPAKFDVRALYGVGSDEASAESLENQRAWANLSLEDQERFYEALKYGRAIPTTAAVTSGPDDDRSDPESETEE